MAYFKVYSSSNDQYFAVLYSNNNEKICWTETYVSKQGAVNAIAFIKANAKDAPVRD